LTIALGTLWQPLYVGQAPGPHPAEEEAVEEEAVEEEAAEEEEAGGNQPLSPRNNWSPFQLSPTCESWERSLESSRGKERKRTAS